VQDPLDSLSASDDPKLATKLRQDDTDSEVMQSDMRLQNKQLCEAMGARQKQWVALLFAKIGTLYSTA
jgi:hypothetical protein